MELGPALRRIGIGRFELDASLAPYTSFRVGGPADAIVFPRDEGEVERAVAFCRREDVPWLLVGNGSNLLVQDGGFRGVAFHMMSLGGKPQLSEGEVWAPASTLLAALCTFMAKAGVGGLEWSAGIPGSVGGAVTMNAGAHGHDMAESVRQVRVVSREGRAAWMARSELQYGYRMSRLRFGGGAAVGAVLSAPAQDSQEGLSLIKSYLKHRKETQPMGNNAGSMFKNPPGDFSGRLVEAAGGKGQVCGDVEISSKHANFFINRGAGTAADVLKLAAWAREAVLDKFGIALELEVEVVGEARGASAKETD